MKTYLISPALDVFDGSGTLDATASRALHIVAEIVASALRQGGDTSQQAIMWRGPAQVDTPPAVVALQDREKLVELVRQCLDPNDLAGGDIRSAVNCRSATFGYDGQAMLCLRDADAAPVSPEPALVTITERSDWLTESDMFDGSWPAAARE